MEMDMGNLIVLQQIWTESRERSALIGPYEQLM
jgi:hypothetical protein